MFSEAGSDTRSRSNFRKALRFAGERPLPRRFRAARRLTTTHASFARAARANGAEEQRPRRILGPIDLSLLSGITSGFGRDVNP